MNVSEPVARKFGLLAFGTALLLIAGAFAVNAIVDPYAMHRTTDIEGINVFKPAIRNRLRLVKAYEVRRLKPQTIILGTSRTHVGIRPSHPAWPKDSGAVYNLAFDGATTKEMDAYLRHAHAVQPLRRVLLGLDTYHLTAARGSTQPDFDDRLLFQDRSLWSRTRVTMSDLRLLVSYDMLIGSVATVLAQTRPTAEWLAADGQRLGEVFFRQPWENYQVLGPRAYFDEIDRQEIRNKLRWHISQQSGGKAKRDPNAQADKITSIGYVQRMIEFCRSHDIELILYITPSHAHQQEIAAAMGEWSAIEVGKRALVLLLAEDGRRHPDKRPFRLYDFSDYNSITTETLPSRGSRAEMRYYWESSHFKQEAGDLVLRRIFDVGTVPADFGIGLNSHNIERELQKVRAQQHVYRATHEKDIADLLHKVAAYKRNNGKRIR